MEPKVAPDAPGPSVSLGSHVVTWWSAALRLGEELATVGPDGYYDFTPTQWLAWARSRVGEASLPAPPARPNCEHGDCKDHYGDPAAWCAKCRGVSQGPADVAALVARLQNKAIALRAYAADLQAIPDHRPYEDGSRLNLELRIEHTNDDAHVCEEAAALLAQQAEQLETLKGNARKMSECACGPRLEEAESSLALCEEENTRYQRECDKQVARAEAAESSRRTLTAALHKPAITDGLRVLKTLLMPCEGADEHSWRKCRRCTAVHGLENRFTLSVNSLAAVVEALDAALAGSTGDTKP